MSRWISDRFQGMVRLASSFLLRHSVFAALRPMPLDQATKSTALLASIAGLYLLTSLVCLALYGLDKRASRRGQRRISERTLLLWGLAGGWPGAWLAQRWWRHKTAKASFRWRFLLTVVVNLGVLAMGARLALPWPG
jgi:uncharacterized membrane protein YsdA (DUF1294 family)